MADEPSREELDEWEARRPRDISWHDWYLLELEDWMEDRQ